MSRKELTIIVPAFNVQEYLENALQSMVCSEAAMDKMEIIITDDGSTDKTADVARKWVTRYPGIFRLFCKTNGGHGSAINEATRLATGRFIKVVDADDTVVTGNLEAYIKFLGECGADAVLSPYFMDDISTGESIIQKMYIDDYNREYTLDEISDAWKSFDRCVTFHGIAYNRAFYNANRHELTEGVYYEDQEYATIPFCLAKKVAVFGKPIYRYRVGDKEQSVSDANQVARISHLWRVIDSMVLYGNSKSGEDGFHDGIWLKKTSAALLSFYTIMCIKNPKKAAGRKESRRITKKMKQVCPRLFSVVRKKYYVYMLFSYLHVNMAQYEKLIHSGLFRRVRKNHGIEVAATDDL